MDSHRKVCLSKKAEEKVKSIVHHAGFPTKPGSSVCTQAVGPQTPSTPRCIPPDSRLFCAGQGCADGGEGGIVALDDEVVVHVAAGTRLSTGRVVDGGDLHRAVLRAWGATRMNVDSADSMACWLTVCLSANKLATYRAWQWESSPPPCRQMASRRAVRGGERAGKTPWAIGLRGFKSYHSHSPL